MLEKQEMYWPTSAWRTLAPQVFGLKPEDFVPLHRSAQEDERVHSLLIIRSGYIVFEEYYHGWSQNHYHNVNSVTKNVTSALVGIALRDKKISTLHQSLFTFFPEYAFLGEQENRKAILLPHLLSLTSGFQLLGEIDTFLEHTASLERILSRPIAHEPGQVFSYDDIDIHLISLILARVTGMPIVDLARTTLFEPLGIWHDEQGQAEPWRHGKAREDAPHPWGLWNAQDHQLWSIDRQGNRIGAFGLQLTTREMAKLGYLYLQQGMWDGQQIIPAEYVQASLQVHSATSKGTDYGYCWYLTRFREQRSFWAIGFGGQLIVCFPDLDLIFAMTARPDIDKPSAHIKIMDDAFGPLVEEIATRKE
jgi:CubicO group peptidase (beta-lactamase class C family)